MTARVTEDLARTLVVENPEWIVHPHVHMGRTTCEEALEWVKAAIEQSDRDVPE